MARTNTTPFRDPRNAVGLLTDVYGLALANPRLAFDREPLDRACDLGRAFTKANRRVINGYARKSHAGLYRHVEKAAEDLPSYAQSFSDAKTRELCATAGSLGARILAIVTMAMEDAAKWDKYTRGYVDRRWSKPVAVEAQWVSDWHDHVSSALRLGADLHEIANLECGWHFRDLTDRSHRGRNVRAAFEAAWLAGQYKFAKQLIAEQLK